MVFWIKRFATILGLLTFFVVLITNVNYSDPLNVETLLPALIKAFVGATLFWLAGIIVGDILIKNVITDIDTVKDDLIDGGILQRVYDQKVKLTPGGQNMPFTESELLLIRPISASDKQEQEKQSQKKSEKAGSGKQSPGKKA